LQSIDRLSTITHYTNKKNMFYNKLNRKQSKTELYVLTNIHKIQKMPNGSYTVHFERMYHSGGIDRARKKNSSTVCNDCWVFLGPADATCCGNNLVSLQSSMKIYRLNVSHLVMAKITSDSHSNSKGKTFILLECNV